MHDIASNTLVKSTPAANIKFQLPPCPPEAALAPTGGVPLAGLGLPFVGPEAHSPADLTAAIRTVTCKPLVHTGVTFSDLPIGGTLISADCMLAKWHADVRSATHRNWCQAPIDFTSVLYLLPRIALPTSEDTWIVPDHVRALFAQQSIVEVYRPDIPNWHYEDTYPSLLQPEPRRWRRPACRGDVTRADVQRFFGSFPALVKTMTFLLGWNPRSTKSTASAESANRVAERLLGFSVDLRFGALVPHDVYMRKLVEACGESTVGGRKTTFAACVAKRLNEELRRVWVPTSEDAGNKLLGAAWSVDVNRWVNAPETWRRG